MPSQRLFLGWDRPILHGAADWLIATHGPDLGRLVVALPAARAGRRLTEILADRLTGQPWQPPHIATAGSLPEKLFPAEGESADELTARLARVASLRTADASVLRHVVPHPPAPDDVHAWWRLAEQFARLSDDLAAGRLRCRDVLDQADRLHLDLGLGEPRWQALADLEARYEQTLPHPDRGMSRRAAIQSAQRYADRPVVLVGMIDLNRQLSAILEKVDDLTALIPAPEAHADGFDALGGLRVEYWQDQPVPIDRLELVDRPADQAIAVVRELAALPEGTPADDVTVGLGDEEAGGELQRAIELAGGAARVAAGRPMSRGGAVLLLSAVGRYASGRRFAELAELARHPDLSRYLDDGIDWLTRLDEYTSTYMLADTRGPWPEPGRSGMPEPPTALCEAIDALLPDRPDLRQPLPNWSEPVAAVLSAVYENRELDPIADHALVESLGAIGQALREQAALPEDAPTTPHVSFAEAVTLTLSRLSGQPIPEMGGTSAVELLGFLELPLDDAPFALLTDVNEGHVPDSKNADAFLPDGLRSALGLADNARRYARDVLQLNVVLHSRQRVTLLSCRRSSEGDPKMPSRLLLACDDDTLVSRVQSFFAEPDDAAVAPLLLSPGPRSRFLIPRPVIDEPVLSELPVTAFRLYLACPYRFYLRYVRGLSGIDDQAVEMDAGAFGNLAHDVLEAFGRSPAAASADAGQINDVLGDMLDCVAARRFGRLPRAAVRIQVEQLRERLAGFAREQAYQVRQGWTIRPDLIEKKQQAVIEVDGQPFTIRGKIDRIDQHRDGRFRILDYKTSDSGALPEKTHRVGPKSDKRWVDLQLPLYHSLVAPLGIQVAELGYLNLPKSVADVKVNLANWSGDELAEAFEQRDHVIRSVRGCVFWPPGDPPGYGDDFSRIAADGAPDRAELIARSGVGDDA